MKFLSVTATGERLQRICYREVARDFRADSRATLQPIREGIAGKRRATGQEIGWQFEARKIVGRLCGHSKLPRIIELPSIATDALTWNLIELSSFVISMIGTSAGACACVIDGDRPDAKRQKITSRIARSLSPSHLVGNWQKLQVERQPLTLAHQGGLCRNCSVLG